MKQATLCYIKRNGETLMLHRVKKENDIHVGKRNGVGGKIEEGESPEDCAVREIREETGLSAKKLNLRGHLTFPNFKNGETWNVFVFLIHEFEGELIECNEGDLEWIKDEEILNLNLWEGDRIFIPWLAKKEGFFSGKFHYVDGNLTGHEVNFY